MRSDHRIVQTVCAVCLLISVWAPASAAAAPGALGSQSAPTGLTTYGEYVMWSQGEIDSQGQVAAYRLVISRSGAAPVVLPVGSRSVPFDADLGPDSAGRVTAVYSRCRQEAVKGGGSFREVSSGLPLYAFGKDCDLYRLDVASARERRVNLGTSRSRSESLPSLWRGDIAYAATSANGRRVTVYHRSLKAGARERTIDGGRRGGTPRSAYPVGLDLYGKNLASVWDRPASRCADSAGEQRYDPVVSELWLSKGREDERVGRGCDSDATVRFSTPSFVAGRLTYLQTLQAGGVAVTLSLSTAKKTSTALAPCTTAVGPFAGSFAAVRLASCADTTLGTRPRVEIERL